VLTIQGNTVVTATFTQNNYTLIANNIGSGSVISQPAQSTYHYGDVVTLTATPSAGWTFVNWTSSTCSAANPCVLTIQSNTIVTATFTQNNYTLIANTIGSGSVVSQPAQSTYHYGDVVTLTATPSAGWTFATWTGSTCSAANPCVLTIQGNTAVTATFTQNNYTLSTNTIGGGSVVSQPAQSTYHYGDTVTVTATPSAGWTFANWTGSTCSAANPCVLTIQGNTIVTATFTQNNYTLNANTIGSGSVVSQPAQSTYHYGDVVTLTATPSAGWTFANWTGSTCSVANPCVLTVQGNTVVTATFTQNNYTLSTNTIGSGSVVSQPAQSTYHYGDVVTLTATPNIGWAFSGWSGDATGILTQTTVVITGNSVVTATFTQINYTLTVNTVGNGTVSVQPNQPAFAYASAVTLTATANAGWFFTQWSGDAQGVLTQTTLSMTDHRVVTATFITPYTVTVSANPGVIIANGISSTIINVTIVDVHGTAVPFAPLTLTATAGNLGNLSGVADSLGHYTTLLTSDALSQTATVTATSNGRQGSTQVNFISIGNPSLQLAGAYTANANMVTLGQVVTFTLVATNTAQSTTQGVWLSTTVPASTVITGSIQGGMLADGVITWTGSLNPSEAHTISFAVMLDMLQPPPLAISSTASGAVQGELAFERTVTVLVNVWRTYLPVVMQ
jgi:hypothetical protein